MFPKPNPADKPRPPAPLPPAPSVQNEMPRQAVTISDAADMRAKAAGLAEGGADLIERGHNATPEQRAAIKAGFDAAKELRRAANMVEIEQRQNAASLDYLAGRERSRGR